MDIGWLAHIHDTEGNVIGSWKMIMGRNEKNMGVEVGVTGRQHTGSPLIVVADGKNASLFEEAPACKELRRCQSSEITAMPSIFMKSDVSTKILG